MQLWGGRAVNAWDGLAAAPQLLLIEAFTAEAHVATATVIDLLICPARTNLHSCYGIDDRRLDSGF
jgi:hypothetical protein